MHYRFWFWSSSHSNRKSYLKLQLHLDLCANPLTKVSKEDMNWNRILIVTHFIASLKSDWTIQPFPLISLSKQWANSSYELSVHTTEIANGKKPSCSSFSMRKRKPLYLIGWTHTHAHNSYRNKHLPHTNPSISLSLFQMLPNGQPNNVFVWHFLVWHYFYIFLFFWIDQKKMQ